MRLGIFTLAAMGLVACGGSAAPARSLTARQALTSQPEVLEFEPPSARQELFREVAKASQSESRILARHPVYFPLSHQGAVYAAPGLDPRADLLGSPPEAKAFQLTFEARGGERWADDAREALLGLSEREAVEQVARSLLAQWELTVTGPVQVDRASGAPYAAAYVDGILRVNPSFLYMAASVSAQAPAAAP